MKAVATEADLSDFMRGEDEEEESHEPGQFHSGQNGTECCAD